jgi:starvation-inducible DNA-binding protein
MHKLFDRFAAEVLGTIDEMAERIRMIGQDVQNRQLKQMQAAANIQSAAEDQSMREMIQEADANLHIIIKDLRDAARAADESNDPGSVDLFSKVVRIHEMHEWFLRQILKTKDDLVR